MAPLGYNEPNIKVKVGDKTFRVNTGLPKAHSFNAGPEDAKKNGDRLMAMLLGKSMEEFINMKSVYKDKNNSKGETTMENTTENKMITAEDLKVRDKKALIKVFRQMIGKVKLLDAESVRGNAVRQAEEYLAYHWRTLPEMEEVLLTDVAKNGNINAAERWLELATGSITKKKLVEGVIPGTKTDLDEENVDLYATNEEDDYEKLRERAETAVQPAEKDKGVRVYVAGGWFYPSQVDMIEKVEGALFQNPTVRYGFMPRTHQGIEDYGTERWADNTFESDIVAMRNSDVIVASITKDSVDDGTMWELAYMYSLGKPVVLVYDGDSINLMPARGTNLFIEAHGTDAQHTSEKFVIDDLATIDFNALPVNKWLGGMI